MKMNETTLASGLMWFRRDLRTRDNAALHRALSCCQQVHCVFVFETAILQDLPRADRRVEFIRESLLELDAELRRLSQRAGAGLIVRHALASDAIPELARQLGVQTVFAARDYEPQARQRDALVQSRLAQHGIGFETCKDQVIFEEREILTQTGSVYSVFTPYKKNWLARLQAQHLRDHDIGALAQRLAERPAPLAQPVPTLAQIGFEAGLLDPGKLPPGMRGGERLFADFFERMDDYHATRDFPAVKGPSYLGVHLRFGTLSIRRAVSLAWMRRLQGSAGAAVWLQELAWRDFYFQILANFPHFP